MAEYLCIFDGNNDWGGGKELIMLKLYYSCVLERKWLLANHQESRNKGGGNVTKRLGKGIEIRKNWFTYSPGIL